MNRILRTIVVPAFAVLGGLVALPSIASADVGPRAPSAQVEHRDNDRGERERFDRERRERERFERERIEREREARAHENMCVRAADSGASRWRLRELGCWVR